MLGLSLGGLVAQELALLAPREVRLLVLALQRRDFSGRRPRHPFVLREGLPTRPRRGTSPRPTELRLTASDVVEGILAARAVAARTAVAHDGEAGRCGLASPANPWRCARKTRAFVRAGIVDPARLQFTAAHCARVEEVAPARADALDRGAAAFARLWREQPFYEPPALAEVLAPLVEDPAAAPPAHRRAMTP